MSQGKMNEMFANCKAFNFKSALDALWEVRNSLAYPGTGMFDYSCSHSTQKECGTCGKKSTIGGGVSCSSSLQPVKATTTVCTFCRDNSGECCSTPTCDNIDGTGNAFRNTSCPAGSFLRNDLSMNCFTTVCAASDCCTDPLPNGDGSQYPTAGTMVLRNIVLDYFVNYVHDSNKKKTLITKYGKIESWDVSRVTNMANVFWNLNVANMGAAPAFNADLSKWQTGAVTTMKSMFRSATHFNGDLSTWKTSSVTDMSLMFYLATNFNGDLSTWQTGAVTEMSNSK